MHTTQIFAEELMKIAISNQEKFDLNKSGIYMIYCLSNEKAYIGKAIKLRRRLTKHRTELNCNIHHNSYMQNAFNKYGKRSFIQLILENCDKEQLASRELFYVNLLHKEVLFNTRTVVAEESWRGKPVHTKESKEKIGKTHRGRVYSEERKLYMREQKLGKPRKLNPKEKNWLGKGKIPRSISDDTARQIKIDLKEGLKVWDIAQKNSTTVSVVRKILKGATYKNVVI